MYEIPPYEVTETQQCVFSVPITGLYTTSICLCTASLLEFLLKTFSFLKPLNLYIKTFFIILSLTPILCCKNMLQNNGPVPITVSRDTFNLSWDADTATIPDLPSSTDHFNLYYRELNAKRWLFLKTTSDNRCMTTLSAAAFDGNNSYELGVQQVYKNGRSSEIHGSTDFDARPAGGWYLLLSQ